MRVSKNKELGNVPEDCLPALGFPCGMVIFPLPDSHGSIWLLRAQWSRLFTMARSHRDLNSYAMGRAFVTEVVMSHVERDLAHLATHGPVSANLPPPHFL